MSKFSQVATRKLLELQKKQSKSESEILRRQTLADIESGIFPQEFVEFLEEGVRTERNVTFEMKPWIRDYMLIFGDMRIKTHVVTGSAQVLKSIGAFLLTYYLTEKRYLSVLFTFAKASIRNKIVASTVKPLFEYNRSLKLDAADPIIDNTTQVRTPEYTLYTSFTNNPVQSESVEVPPELASISVDIVFIDEFQQSDSRVVGVLSNRMNASSLEFNPEYYLSTPGSEGTGVDNELSKCDDVFEAHTECPHCKQWTNLNPLKSFLTTKPIINSDGESIDRYYDDGFNISGFHHSNPDNPIDSAYIACQFCKGKLEQSDLDKARMLERRTHITAEEYHQEVNKDPFKVRKVGLLVNPFLRRTKRYIAPRLAREAQETENPKDYLQQKLGIATSSNADGISKESIARAIALPEEPADLDTYLKVKMLGADIARGSNYLTVMDCYIPLTGTKQFKYNNTKRYIRSFERVSSAGMVQFARNQKIEYGAVDLAPDYHYTTELCKDTKWLPVLQKKSFKSIIKENDETETGGIKVKAIDVDNQYFLNRIVTNFGRQNIISIPDNLQGQLNDPPRTSVVYHLKSLEFDIDRGLWQKPADGSSRCDYVYSTLFAEVALYYYILNKPSQGWLSFYTE